MSRASNVTGAIARVVAVALSALVLVPSTANADDVRRDEHSRMTSPESSSGVNPHTTRGMNRGMPSQTTLIDSAEVRDPDRPRAPSDTATTTGTPSQAGTTQLTGADWDPKAMGDAPAGAYRLTPHRPLLITGVALFAATYGATALAASTSETPMDDKLYAPVVGPWLDMAERQCSTDACPPRNDLNLALVIGSGVLQAAGLGLAVSAFFVEEPRERPRAVRVMPISVGRGGAGLGAVGSF